MRNPNNRISEKLNDTQRNSKKLKENQRNSIKLDKTQKNSIKLDKTQWNSMNSMKPMKLKKSYLVINIKPFWVVIHFICFQGNPGLNLHWKRLNQITYTVNLISSDPPFKKLQKLHVCSLTFKPLSEISLYPCILVS